MFRFWDPWIHKIDSNIFKLYFGIKNPIDIFQICSYIVLSDVWSERSHRDAKKTARSPFSVAWLRSGGKVGTWNFLQ